MHRRSLCSHTIFELILNHLLSALCLFDHGDSWTRQKIADGDEVGYSTSKSLQSNLLLLIALLKVLLDNEEVDCGVLVLIDSDCLIFFHFLEQAIDLVFLVRLQSKLRAIWLLWCSWRWLWLLCVCCLLGVVVLICCWGKLVSTLNMLHCCWRYFFWSL